MDADYVIVGAGAAGCVLAARLSDDPAVRVVLLEAGGRNRNPLLRVPKAFAVTMNRPAHAQAYATDTGEWWLRGRGLGGSTVINGMIWVRGWADDYDALGADALSWPRVLAAFRALEDHALGGSEVRGAGGPVRIAVPPVTDPVGRAVHAAAVESGLAPVEDVNASDAERVGPVPSTIHRGRRVDAAGAVLRPVARRVNLRVLTGVRAEQVLVRGGRAVAVAGRQGQRSVVVRAAREVILAAGAIESPLLLERSGIGDPDLLRRSGIELVAAAPRVGEGLLEHRGVLLRLRLRDGLGLNQRLATPARRARVAAGYLLTRDGPMATGPYDVLAQVRSSPDRRRPDAQILATPFTADPGSDRLRPARTAGLTLQGYQIRPTTGGSVHVTAADPLAPPRITAPVPASDAERQVAARVLDRLRRLAAASPLAGHVVGEETPGPDVAGVDAVAGHVRTHGGGLYHAVGSCALGPDDGAVVDTRLRVRGVRGLRVVDASVFPAMPSANTAGPVMAIAWCAAEEIARG